MSRLLQVELPNGQVIWARVATEGPADVGTSDVVRKLRLDDLRETVAGVTHSVAKAIENLRPDQVSLEFGIELAVKTGKLTSVLAEGSATGNLKLTMSWNADGARHPLGTTDAEDAHDTVASPDVVAG